MNENKNIDVKELLERIKKPKPRICGECHFCELYTAEIAYCNYYRRTVKATDPYCFTNYNDK